METYINAAFALHPDSKSYSGIAVFIGKSLVFAASQKQKNMTKSPKENELAALNDYLIFV